VHPFVERLPRPDPDYRRFIDAVFRRKTDRVPLIELAVDPNLVDGLLFGGAERTASSAASSAERAARLARLLCRLGYDVVKVSADIPFGVSRVTSDAQTAGDETVIQWQNQRRGLIDSIAACDAYAWPTAQSIDCSPIDAAANVLPDTMRIVGFSGGVLEFATDLMGLEPFMYAMYDQPDLVERVINQVGQTVYSVFEEYCRRDAVCAIWLGDDLGSKNGLLVAPDFLRAQIFPWYRSFVELAHANNRPFLLHTCGRTEAIMDELIDDIGIDAKHSFEDAIQPVEQFIDRWGDRIGVLGGVDVGLLASASPDEIAQRTHQILEHATRRGGACGYACGSGNSIAGYVRIENYITMIETVMRFNGMTT